MSRSYAKAEQALALYKLRIIVPGRLHARSRRRLHCRETENTSRESKLSHECAITDGPHERLTGRDLPHQHGSTRRPWFTTAKGGVSAATVLHNKNRCSRPRQEAARRQPGYLRTRSPDRRGNTHRQPGIKNYGGNRSKIASTHFGRRTNSLDFTRKTKTRSTASHKKPEVTSVIGIEVGLERRSQQRCIVTLITKINVCRYYHQQTTLHAHVYLIQK